MCMLWLRVSELLVCPSMPAPRMWRSVTLSSYSRTQERAYAFSLDVCIHMHANTHTNTHTDIDFPAVQAYMSCARRHRRRQTTKRHIYFTIF